jgi:putative ABC transport system permease protein
MRQRLVSTLRSLLGDAYLSLTARPLRTAGMVAGIVLGVAAATAAVIIADTQQVEINKRFDAQRSQFVVLQQNGGSSATFPRVAVGEVEALSPVSSAGEFSIWNESAPVSTSGFAAKQDAPLLALTSSGGRASDTRTVAGLPISAVDRVPDVDLAWVGVQLAQRLGITMRSPSTVVILGRPFTVAGLVRNVGSFGYVDTSVLVSSTLARKELGPGSTVRFLAHVRPGSAAAVAKYAMAVLDPAKTRQLANATPPDGRILVGHVVSDLRRIGLALSLFVGLIGMLAVANTLSMAVAQRSRELGLRSAMGWSGRRLAGLIITESAVAGLAAALIGCALGMLGAWIWCQLQGWQLIVPPLLALVAVCAAMAASVLGGLFPARRAAAVSPLEAMRS